MKIEDKFENIYSLSELENTEASEASSSPRRPGFRGCSRTRTRRLTDSREFMGRLLRRSFLKSKS